jgi:hypothetical protein
MCRILSPRARGTVPGRLLSRSTGVTMVLLASLLATGCGSTGSAAGLANPPQSEPPAPDYANVCAPLGADTSTTCLRITLEAIDGARAHEGLRPMIIPADFAQLSVPEQLFVAVDRERVDRGLAPFTGLSAGLDRAAEKGAANAGLPPSPGHGYASVATEWIGAVDNGLDADFQWLYDDGPDSGVPGCSGGQTSGCWADRDLVLAHIHAPHRPLEMGAGFEAAADTTPEDLGGSSLAATFAAGPAHQSPAYAYTWAQALADTARGRLEPLRAVPRSESATGIADPRHNVQPSPDFTSLCTPHGIDVSSRCLGAVLAATNHAHALEGIRPMVLPSGFANLSVPEQLFVAINLERVDRGLAPFAGLTTALDQNAQRGANEANDPPDPGRGYLLDDAEWAGGSANGLDAVYGWMYDDGYASGNLDCLRRGAAGCWGHRKGILDDFGAGPALVMGAALNATGDTHEGDDRGTSMAVTMAVARSPAQLLVYTWAQATASGATPGSP